MKQAIAGGVILVILSPVLGFVYSNVLLRLLGGMETEAFYVLIRESISAIRTVGIIISACGIVHDVKGK